MLKISQTSEKTIFFKPFLHQKNGRVREKNYWRKIRENAEKNGSKKTLRAEKPRALKI